MINKKNSISFWKCISTIMIICLHKGIGVGWKMAVEFFFIISWLLLAQEYDEKKEIDFGLYEESSY